MYRADATIAKALDLYPRFREAQIAPDVVARQFNDANLYALRQIVPANVEAFIEYEVIPTDEVTDDANLVDLTRAGLVSWHTIDAIDYRTSSTGKYKNQVGLLSHEARHRVGYELEHTGRPRGFLFDGQAQLQKVAGWESVYDLRVTGLKNPTEIDALDNAVVFPYPAGVGEVCKFRLALMLSPQAKMPLNERQQLERWLDRAEEDARREVKHRVTQGAQFEDLPIFGE